MATFFSTNEDDWQGVDSDPTAGSRNLVESGGVYSFVNAGNGECPVALATVGYVNSTDGMLMLHGTGLRVMLLRLKD